MEPETKKFGRGAKEVNGAADLIRQYKLEAQHEFFCRRPLPLPISETHYLHNVPGDTEIRRGARMELGELFGVDSVLPSLTSFREMGASIQPFDPDSLRLAFSLREAAPVELPPGERGVPTVSGKVKEEPRDKSRKHKKHRDKEHKEHKKHKHRHKDRIKDKDKDKDRKREKERDKDRDKKDKKRKHDGGEDVAGGRENKKSKVHGAAFSCTIKAVQLIALMLQALPLEAPPLMGRQTPR